MEYKVKRISTAGIAEAIAKAELYRSLNEPEEAESICRDILAIEPQHQLALRLLGLALTDQFTGGEAVVGEPLRGPAVAGVDLPEEGLHGLRPGQVGIGGNVVDVPRVRR